MATRPRPNSPPHPSDKSGTFTINNNNNNNNHSRNSSSRGIGLGLGLEYENEGYHSDAPSEQSQDLARRIKEQERHLKEGRPSSIDMALDMERELESDLEEHEHEHENEQELSHGRDANISGGNKNDIDDDESGLKPESSGTEYLDEVDLIGSNAALNSNSKDQQQSLPQQPLPQQQQKQYPNLGKKPGMIDDGSRRVSLDPHVLSAIIANLRADLENATRERDALTAELERVPARETELREALALLTERAAELEGELAKLRRKSQEDDESIQMLRTKVEESRRGLMRLQTENKRVSMMSLDTGRANSLFGAGPSSSKRTSFTPLTGSGAGRIPGHRRISSVSEPPSLHEFNIGDTASLKLSPSKAGGTISLPDESGQQEDVKKSRRSSAFYAPARSGATSPIFDSQEVSFGDMISASQAQAQVAQAQAQIEALIRERDAAHSLLASTKQELAEAQEAREASEQCVVALRTFISANNVGEDGPPAGGEILKLPPLPTEKNMDDEKHASSPPKRPTVGTGWSFGKLWRSDSGGVGGGSSGMTAPVDSIPRRSSSESTSVITPVSSSGPGLSVTGSTPTTPGQSFSRKLGGFFGGRGQSVTSITSVTSYTESAHPPTTHGQQEPIANGLGSDDEGENGEERERGMPSASASVSTGGMSADDGPSEPVSPDIEITNVVVVKDVEETEINTPIARIEHEVEHGVNEKQPMSVVSVPEAASVDSGLV